MALLPPQLRANVLWFRARLGAHGLFFRARQPSCPAARPRPRIVRIRVHSAVFYQLLCLAARPRILRIRAHSAAVFFAFVLHLILLWFYKFLLLLPWFCFGLLLCLCLLLFWFHTLLLLCLCVRFGFIFAHSLRPEKGPGISEPPRIREFGPGTSLNIHVATHQGQPRIRESHASETAMHQGQPHTTEFGPRDKG